MMPIALGNRMYTTFLARLMYVFPAICPREVETRLFYKDKLEFTNYSPKGRMCLFFLYTPMLHNVMHLLHLDLL